MARAEAYLDLANYSVSVRNMRRRPILSVCIGTIGLVGTVVLVTFLWPQRADPAAELNAAAAAGDLGKVQALLAKGRSINGIAHGGFTPLIEAITNGETNMVRYLVESGADVNLRDDRKGCTPLIWLVAWGDRDAEVLSYLISHGADLNARDRDGHTVLDYARASPPRPKTLKLLQEALDRSGITQTNR